MSRRTRSGRTVKPNRKYITIPNPEDVIEIDSDSEPNTFDTILQQQSRRRTVPGDTIINSDRDDAKLSKRTDPDPDPDPDSDTDSEPNQFDRIGKPESEEEPSSDPFEGPARGSKERKQLRDLLVVDAVTRGKPLTELQFARKLYFDGSLSRARYRALDATTYFNRHYVSVRLTPRDADRFGCKKASVLYEEYKMLVNALLRQQQKKLPKPLPYEAVSLKHDTMLDFQPADSSRYQPGGLFNPENTSTKARLMKQLPFATDYKHSHAVSKYFDLPQSYKTIVPGYDIPPNSFPEKENRRFFLHHVGPRYSYQIDIMFSNPFSYLFAININSRFLFVECMNIAPKPTLPTTDEADAGLIVEHEKKLTDQFLNALRKMLLDGMEPKVYSGQERPKIYLKGDAERCFTSKKSENFRQIWNIEFTAVQTKGSSHTHLSVVDRAIRTIRDMHYRYMLVNEFENRDSPIDPVKMKHYVINHNKTPNKTFKQIMGFDISPAMLEENEELLHQISTRQMQSNLKILSGPEFKLTVGSTVKLKNIPEGLEKKRSQVKPQYYRVESVEAPNKFRVVGIRDGETKIMPRFMLQCIRPGN